MASSQAILKQAVLDYSDWRWRLDNLYWITNEEGKRVRFRLNWAQERLYGEMWFLNIILKARQLGFTTFTQLLMLDACLFNSNTHAGTIAHTREDAERFFRDKVRYPYDNLPEGVRQMVPATEESARALSFGNNSTLRVGTSLRSGTYQWLHVSEFGKICAKYPEKAREIVTGALNTVHAGQFVFIESTAEGQAGRFYEMCETAQSRERSGGKLTTLDYKFHFFPWWKHPSYVLDPEDVTITAESKEYFSKLKAAGIDLTAEQAAWYVKKAETQGDDMKREFPSTPKEAFEAAVEGSYYAHEMARAEEQGRICDLPILDVKTETWWDLGMDDTMSIAWVQRDGPWSNVIDYYENSGYGLRHYAEILAEKQKHHGLVYGDHIWPHDGAVRILDEEGRKRTEVMVGLGYQPVVVPRGGLAQGIEATRQMLNKTRFDRVRCSRLVNAAKSYRREWDEERATYRNKPAHDWASHPADMLRTGAMYEPLDDYSNESWEEDWQRDAISGY